MSNAKIRHRRLRRSQSSAISCRDAWVKAWKDCREFENKMAYKYGLKDCPTYVLQKHLSLLNHLDNTVKRLDLLKR